jgi:hypothetical protein
MAHDNNRDRAQSVKMKRVLIANNVWEDIGGPRWGGMGILFQLREGTADVTIERNSGMQTGFLVHAEGPPHQGFRFIGNVAPHNQDGITGRDYGTGNRALQALFPGAVVRGNIFGGGDASLYPAGNRFLSSAEALPLMNPKTGDYRFAASKEYGTDIGEDGPPGADVAALCRALGPLRAQERMCRPPVADALQRSSSER